jgi:tRNA/tmRNA/rRNA uracil-C5-methylase (TrmA/RlmC/RlmD family)
MDFQTKSKLTQQSISKHIQNTKISILEDETAKKINYRNKTVYSFQKKKNPKQDALSFSIIDTTHIEIINMLKTEIPNIWEKVKDVFIKSNNLGNIQLCFTIYNPNTNLMLTNPVLNEILTKLKLNQNIKSVYYRLYDNNTKSQFDKKEIEQIHIQDSKKLEENILGTKLYLSPYTFSRINTIISPKIYKEVHKLVISIDNINPIINPINPIINPINPINHIILYGRDIYYLSKFFINRDILAVTHCKITYQDIVTDPDLVKQNKKLKKGDYIFQVEKKNYTKLLNEKRKLEDKSQVILTAGRNGLEIELVEYFIEFEQIKSIVYIACNRETMSRDLDILSSKFIIDECIIIDEFPKTEYNNTILHLCRRENEMK